MKILLSLILFVLAGCATQKSELAQNSPSRLVGQTRQAVLACMGKPDRQEHQDDADRLVFTGTASEPVCPMKKLAGVAPPPVQCEAVFTLQADKVKTVKLQATSGNSKKPAEDCAFLLAKCPQQ